MSRHTREVCSEVRDAALLSLSEMGPDEPCGAVQAVAVLESLGFDDGDVHRGNARAKLEGKPCVKVREFAEYARGRKPEERQHLLTMFSRRVPAA